MQIDIDFIRFGTFVLFGLHLFECDDRSKRTSQKNKEFRLKQNRYNLGKRLKRREKERKEEEKKTQSAHSTIERCSHFHQFVCITATSTAAPWKKSA